MAEVEDKRVLDWRSERKLEDQVKLRGSHPKTENKKGTQFIRDFIPKGLTTQISIFVLTRPTLSFVLVWSPLLRNQWDEKEERTSTSLEQWTSNRSMSNTRR
ncbi:hypothetical protein CEXT_613691 [Caerostris extrusa]|uniref:Uncharacterized protein n=1 Tax=Caerostris extrusa TaxID=172846 RepID=A0AAV4XZ75_CAEEX|nr:hypothetical protein CEXT_613691 [Caerostris extrusa]